MSEENKKPQKPKAPWFYAVHVGKTPGVYKTPEESKAQTDGHAGAKSKKFRDLAEAQAYVKHGEPPSE